MKITNIDTFAVEGLSRPWVFCAIRTDEGITGYSEFGRGTHVNGLMGLVKDFSELLIGKDPRLVEQHYERMFTSSEALAGGATQMAIGGIELALWDIKGKATGMPVHELLGGPTRTEQRVYWSHLGSYHAMHPDKLGLKLPQTWDDVRACVRMAVDAGYTHFKTNMIFPGCSPSERERLINNMDKAITKEALRTVTKQIEVMRDEAGEDVDISLDVARSFRPESNIKIARAMEPFNLAWLEIDNLNAGALQKVRSSTRTTILTGERLLAVQQYYPYLEARAMDIMKVDVQWQGFIPARQAAQLAAHYELNIAPHNYNGHLSTFQSINLCATLTNVKVCECDPLSAPWRDELFTVIPEVSNGYMKVPTGPGWGTDLNEEAARKYGANISEGVLKGRSLLSLRYE
jgi:galactonate dehydratase